MAIFDVFKKKEEEKKVVAKPKKPVAKKPEKKVEKKAEKKAEKVEKPKKQKKITGLAYKVLKSAHVTEKATDLAEKNQYVFNVWPRSNKKQVKDAVEEVYGIDVVSVRIVNIHSKTRRLGRRTGTKKGYKKAIVKVKEGQKIEILPR